jgi:hypothetical protein
MTGLEPEKAVWKASKIFAPSFPRQSSDNHTIQKSRSNRTEFCAALDAARKGKMPGYYSVYSFPRGHSRDGKIPEVDCIFIDLDVEGGDYDPNNGDTDFAAWRRDMSALLARARMIADAIIEEGQQDFFRATLSGHKGLHLYLDFPPIAASNGSFNQFKNGLKQYGEQVMSWLDATAGGVSIDTWVDVDASDLGRLARHPNTIHHGAAYDDETRWCVPITIRELANLHVDDYLAYTKEPRWPDGYQRTPSETAGDKVVQAIRNARDKQKKSSSGGSTYNAKAVRQYDDEANEDIELEDVAFLTSNYPCIMAFKDREDAFDHGNASHLMEVNVIGKLVELRTPRAVIHEFFEQIPGYREQQTEVQIDKIIGRQYRSFNCNSIADEASMFCLGQQCSVYKRNDDIQK